MAKKVIKFQDSLGEYLNGCESTKVTLKAIMIDINLEHFKLEGNVDIIIGIINDVEGLNTLDDNNIF